MCSTKEKRKETVFVCKACPGEPGLCSEHCFSQYHKNLRKEAKRPPGSSPTSAGTRQKRKLQKRDRQEASCSGMAQSSPKRSRSPSPDGNKQRKKVCFMARK